MGSWSPILVQTLTSLAVLIGVGLAVFGQVRWRGTQEWETLAEAQGKRIELLEKEIGLLRGEIAEKNERLATLGRLNYDLQRQLKEPERRKYFPESPEN